MSQLYRLTCTITKEDMEMYEDENLFLRSYFPVEVITRAGIHYKYYSLATEDYPKIILALEQKLLSIGITNYSFNISSDYLLESVSK